ncbi:unnamed protein product [Rotaria socialis]|uniref:SOCS box domain-containing protein n=1 Tax=Rotaria socialis TaxID=392032 RepID=A0A818KHX2_9BILA|nr:unnamed protein product [Rotaria socialis]CAF3425102.1 unnamed protein product [Rotaria socialis]CAF3459651.1 unnamed protein product [Rotaria socialis]CAF3554243.1 unnamed protein product [Rotaria socialis]CAF3558501.1 unnamed protein product [Rotaria socialis]
MGNGITINKKQLPGVPQPPGARKIVVIPYQKWIYHDARRFGHFNQFSTDSGCEIISNNNNSNNNTILSVLPSLSSSSFSPPTSFVSTSLSLTNDFVVQTKTQLTSSSVPSSISFLTNKSNIRNNNNNQNPSASALVGSAMTLSSSSSTVTCASIMPSSDSDSRRLNPKPVYYVNGRFFKSLTRLGDAQFILSEHGEDDIILTVPSNIERYRTNDNTVRERIHRLNRVIACCDEFIVFQLWKGNNEVEIFVFDRPILAESSDGKISSKKCTCFHRQTKRHQLSPIPSSEQTVSTTRANTPNRHSSLMQTATLSAYHTSEPQRSPVKSCSLLNDTENRFDMQNDAYEFVDNTKKISYLTGSARCTLVTASAAIATHYNINHNTNVSNNTLSSAMSRIRFGKSNSRSKSASTRSYAISSANDVVNSKNSQNLIHDTKHRSTPYLSSLSCNCMDNHESVLLSSSSSSPTFYLSSSSTWNSRIVRKFNSVAHRFNARSYACLISPDRTKLLITPDYEDKHSYSHQIHEVTVIFDIKTYVILRITPARYDQRFSFDPRYGHSRLAEFDTVRGQITDITKDRVLVCSNHTLKTKVYRVEYTNDGHLIIVLCTLPIFQRVKRNYFLYILNSSTLLHTRSIIDYRGPFFSPFVFTNEFSLLFNIYPSLSNCGSTLAVLKNIEPSLNVRLIEVYSLPYTCTTLKEVTRRNILRYVDRKQIKLLRLPDNLKAYLAYKPQFT